MKKVAYIAGGILIGFVLSTSAGAFADSVKSLVGKKVSGEYTVIVDGLKLADKGAIIDGRANVPVRGISEALGADIKVEGKTITVTSSTSETGLASQEENKYEGKSRQTIEMEAQNLKENVLRLYEAEKASLLKEIDQARTAGADDLVKVKEAQLAETEARIAATNADIVQAEAALAALK
nr:stalk domain-containing protein [Paenibacillus xylanexedens]